VYNNPLIYNDPSGEILVSAIIIAGSYLALSAINGSFNPAKWNTASQIVFAVAVGIATAGALAGWAKVGSIFTKAAWAKTGFAHKAFIGEKLVALKGNLVAGGINSLYNYDGDVLSSLGYFTAGFFGSAIGIGTASVFKGMLAGGIANIAAALPAGGLEGKGTLYKIAQKFVGGALSSLAGMQSFYKAAELKKGLSIKMKKAYDFKTKANYLFGTKNKALSKAFTYGVQNVGTNFAYSDWDKFSKNNFGNQLLNFGFGMAHGFGQYDVFKNFDNGFAERFVGSSILYYADYMIGTPLNTGYFGFDYYDRNKKIGIFSLKSFASSLGF
jgi:hypothetical protein